MRLVALAVAFILATQPQPAHANLVGDPSFDPNRRSLPSEPELNAPGTIRVDPFMGTSPYSYPFALPRGTGGHTPGVALSWSSVVRRSEFGWGWSLNVPVIRRSVRSGAPSYEPIEPGEELERDAIELNGNRLVRGPLSEDTSQSVRFYLRQHDGSRIVYDPSADAWEVTKTNGERLLFGSRAFETDSRMACQSNRFIEPNCDDVVGVPQTFRWALDEVIDPNGNSYRIDWEDGGRRPVRFRYTYNDDHPLGHEGRWLVELEYSGSTAPDSIITFRPGFAMAEGGLLRRVSVGTDVDGSGTLDPGEVISSYEITAGGHKGGIRAIQRVDGDGVAFESATTFSYLDRQWSSPDDRLERPQEWFDAAGGNHHPSNIGGYPHPGFHRLMTNPNHIYSRGTVRGEWMDFDSDKYHEPVSGVQTYRTEYDRDPDSELFITVTHTESLRADLDGDGFATPVDVYRDSSGDVIISEGAFSYNFEDHLGIHGDDPHRACIGHTTHVRKADLDFPYETDWDEVDSKLMDVTGDGLPDFVANGRGSHEATHGRIAVYVNTGTTFLAPQLWTGTGMSSRLGNFPVLGRTEHIRDLGMPLTGTVHRSRGVFMDVNHDGLVDFLPGDVCFGTDDSVPHQPTGVLAEGHFINTGRGWVSSGTTCNSGWSFNTSFDTEIYDSSYGAHNLKSVTEPVTDINGDGRLESGYSYVADMLAEYDHAGDPILLPTTPSGHWYTEFTSSNGGPAYDRNAGGSVTHAGFADYNGDGMLDYYYRDTLGRHMVALHKGGVKAKQPLLVQVVNELGLRTTLSFVELSDPDWNQTGVLVPMRPDHPRAPWVVKSIVHSYDDGATSGGTQSKQFEYTDARYDLENNEYAGVAAAYILEGTLQTRNFYYQDVRRRGRAHQEEIWDYEVRDLTQPFPVDTSVARDQLHSEVVVFDPVLAADILVMPECDMLEIYCMAESVGLILSNHCASWDSTDCGVTATDAHLASVKTTHWSATPTQTETGASIDDSWMSHPVRSSTWLTDPLDPTATTTVRTTVREFAPVRGEQLSEHDYGPDGVADTDDDHRSRTEFVVDEARWLTTRTDVYETLGLNSERHLGFSVFVDGNLKKQRTLVHRNDRPYAVETARWTYDDFGNPTAHFNPIDNAQPVPKPTTWVVEWDAETASFPLVARNAFGHTMEFEHDLISGQPTKVLDVNGNLSCASYDGFGRLVGLSRSANTHAVRGLTDACQVPIAAFEFHNMGSNHTQYILGRSFTSAGEELHKVRYVDGFGRHYRVEQSGAYQQTRVSFRGWDERGQEACASLAVHGPVDPLSRCGAAAGNDVLISSHTAFDVLGRPVQRSRSEGGTDVVLESTAYAIQNGLLHEISTLHAAPTADRVRVRKLNNRGDATMIDEGAVRAHTHFAYDARGRVVRVKGGNITTVNGVHKNEFAIAYDSMDRRTHLRLMEEPVDYYLEPQWHLGWVWHYDAMGNLAKQRTPAGRVKYFTHDRLGRLAATHSTPFDDDFGREDVQYIYDAPGSLGLLSEVRAPGVWTELSYDAWGRTTAATKDFAAPDTIQNTGLAALLSSMGSSGRFTTQTQYDIAGRALRKIYPDGSVAGLSYDGAEVTALALDGMTQLGGVQYNAAGLMTLVHYGSSGVVSDYAYDPATLRLAYARTETPEEVIQDMTYEYDRAGNLIASLDASVDDVFGPRLGQTFTYDKVHRLTKAVSSGAFNYGTIRYWYNGSGNLTKKTQGGFTYDYRYGGGGARPDAVTRVERTFGWMRVDVGAYEYDADGAVTAREKFGDRLELPRDSDGRVAGAGGTTFYYDADGLRVRKSSVNREHLYVSNEYEVIIEAGVPRHDVHLFLGDKRAATVERSGLGDDSDPGTHLRTLYHHDNQVGSSRFATDAQGNVVRQLVLDPFGGVHQEIGDSTAGDYLFTGHEYDRDSELHYMKARFYDPWVARFMSADPALYGAVAGGTFNRLSENTQTVGAYTYVENNPLVAIDPTGRERIELIDHQTRAPGGTMMPDGSRRYADIITTGRGSDGKMKAVRYTSDGASRSNGNPGPDSKGNVSRGAAHRWAGDQADIVRGKEARGAATVVKGRVTTTTCYYSGSCHGWDAGGQPTSKAQMQMARAGRNAFRWADFLNKTMPKLLKWGSTAGAATSLVTGPTRLADGMLTKEMLDSLEATNGRTAYVLSEAELDEAWDEFLRSTGDEEDEKGDEDGDDDTQGGYGGSGCYGIWCYTHR